MNISFLFSFGFLATILEIHLISFDLTHISIALCFVLESTTYLALSLSAGTILKNIDERTIMMFGAVVLSLAYLMLGPCSYIFPKNLFIVILSLPVFSLGQTLSYSNFLVSF